MYFRGYRRLVYLAQTDDPDLRALARRAADSLGLAYAYRRTGLGDLGARVTAFADVGAAADGVAVPA